jgi:hypothetical protein
MAATDLNLLDLSVLEQKDMNRAVMFAMFKGVLPSPMDLIPVSTAKSLSQQTLRLTNPGSTTTRALGGAAGDFKAQFSDKAEPLTIIHDDIKLDPVHLDIKTYVQDPIALQVRAYGQTVRAKINDMMINGDQGSDETLISGFFPRLRDDPTFLNQSVDAGTSGTPLNVDGSDANMFLWLDKIDEAITLCGGGNPDLCIVNRQTWIKLRSILRRQKLLDTTRDQYDRELMTYGNVKILNAGQKEAGLLTSAAAQQVIGDDTLTDNVGNSNATPMYFVQTTGEEGVRLLQLHSMRVKRVGLNTNNTAEFVVTIIWPVGLLIPQKFALSALMGLDIT